MSRRQVDVAAFVTFGPPFRYHISQLIVFLAFLSWQQATSNILLVVGIEFCFEHGEGGRDPPKTVVSATNQVISLDVCGQAHHRSLTPSKFTPPVISCTLGADPSFEVSDAKDTNVVTGS